MKKLGLLVMPLMTISLLVSCGGNNNPQTVEHFVSFNSNGGDYVKTKRVKDKGVVSEPDPIPKKTDYTFDGWYTDEEAVEYKYDFSRPVVADLTLYAKWNANEYTVIFNANGGTYAETKSGIVTRNNVPCNTMPNIPDDPIKVDSAGIKGYIFIGYDKNVVPVTGDATTITYTAKWKEITNVYTLNVTATDEGKFPDSDITKNITLAAGSNILNSIAYLSDPIFNDSNAVKVFNDYVYEDDSEISPSDIVNKNNITIKATYRNKTLEECSWAEISTISNQGKDFAASYFGPITSDAPLTKTVMVNNQPHTVRIIGYGQDVDANDNPIGITFEFATLISDNRGYSIATQWNDTSDSATANHNYLDSSVRMALVGENQEKGHILWAQKGNKYWSNEEGGPLTNKSVLDMLPSSGDINHPDLKEVLVAPKKTVMCKGDSDWESVEIKNEQGEFDKLFLLSLEEAGDNATREGAYAYYQEKDEEKLNSLRIKKQVNGEEEFTKQIIIPEGKGQIYDSSVWQRAGYNHKSDSTGGGQSWLRSPYSYFDNRAFHYSVTGNFAYYYVDDAAFAVAPAFCI